MARIIESPGVQINEIDLSTNATLPVGTDVLINGFADQGPTLELVNITSKSELEQIYGAPTTEAERYFYNSCTEVLNTPANLIVNRLPYGGSDGDNYTGLFYPVEGLSGASVPVAYESASAFTIGAPTMLELTETQYLDIKAGQISWQTQGTSVVPTTATMGNVGFILLNKNKANTDQIGQGYYVALIDNTSVSDLSGNIQYDSVTGINTVNATNPTGWGELNNSVLGTYLTGTPTSQIGSISENLESGFPYTFDDSSYKDSLILAVFKLRKAITAQDEQKIYIGNTEKYIGSLDNNDIRAIAGSSSKGTFFLEDKVNAQSSFLEMFVNPNLSKLPEYENTSGERAINVTVDDEANAGFALGSYVSTRGTNVSKKIGEVPLKLTNALLLAENKEVVDVDIVCEAGLGTVFAYAKMDDANDPSTFDATMNVASSILELADVSTGTSSDVGDYWQAVNNVFETFVSDNRKDCILISDPIRGIFIQGDDFKVIERTDRSFSQSIYWPLRNQFGEVNNNYVCTYGNWVKVYDLTSGKYTWMPFSAWEAGIMARMDANLQPWYAPAGLENGIVRNIVDIAINPTQKQRDMLYKIGVNPVVYFPNDAYTVWGQKTLQSKPSAFDRINVRRLFLVLEKATLKLCRYFVMQPNTVFTRTRLVNYLTPIFDIAKENEGVYDYMLVCDERNNTGDVIDANELKLDVYLKPVRTAEFILVNFIATRTSADFNELIG